MIKISYKGTSSSNLGWGDRTLASVIVNGWMNDGDTSNIDRVGHRRWCLNPRMQATGFGHSGSYTGMYSFDNWNNDSGSAPDLVLWPGQTMPAEYFSGPWNVSFSKDVYSLKSSDKSKIKITMTSEKNGKEYSIRIAGLLFITLMQTFPKARQPLTGSGLTRMAVW